MGVLVDLPTPLRATPGAGGFYADYNCCCTAATVDVSLAQLATAASRR